MAKNKNKSKRKQKNRQSDNVQAKKKVNVKTNPFEVKINRNKHQILGRVVKHDRGLPGVSRQKSVSKRKNTLLKEYSLQGKSSVFLDKRIGEKDAHLSNAERAMARLVAQRSKRHKSSVYNLNEDEELTHLGKPVSEIEKCKDLPSDSDSDDNLGADFVSKAHFGGFLTKKSDSQSEPSHKDIVNELIAQSKQRKHEKQVVKDANVEMTEKLDEEWKELRKLLPSKPKSNTAHVEVDKIDAFDVMVHELQFEVRGHPTDRLKTDEELAREEKEKLVKLEKERLRRMEGVYEKNTGKRTHLSADDLDDGLALDNDNEEEEDKRSEHDEESENDQVYETQDQSASESEESSDNENDNDESSEDNYTDLDIDGEDSSDEDDHKATKMNDAHESLKTRKNCSSSLKIEIPFVIPAPSTYEEFLKLVSGRNHLDCLTVIERILKCNHPALQEDNKQKMETFFGVLLKYLQDACCEGNVEIVDSLISHLYSIASMCPVNSAQCLLSAIQSVYNLFEQELRKKGNKKPYPNLGVLVLLKAACTLYSASDFMHCIVTPCMLFMSQILTECTVANEQDLLLGLFVCGTFLQCISFSKRIVPEALTYLHCLLATAVDKTSLKSHHIAPVRNFNAVLLIDEDMHAATDIDWTIPLSILVDKNLCKTNDLIKIKITKLALDILIHFATAYEETLAFAELFGSLENLVSILGTEKWPEALVETAKTFVQNVRNKKSGKTSLMLQKNKPKPLKLYEPKIGNFKTDTKKNAQKLLLPRYKRELKGAVREVRRDNSFLARHLLRERMERDAERKRKVNKLMQELAEQEGSFRALKKKK